MNVYRRYFKITAGPIIEAAEEVLAVNNRAKKEYKALLAEYNAKKEYYHRDDKMVGILFEGEPDRHLFKKLKHGWWPKKNSKAAMAVWEKFNAVKTKKSEDLLPMMNISPGPVLFGGGKCHFSLLVIIPSEPPVIHVSIPWYDEDPANIKKYKVDKANGGSTICGNQEYICWEPTEDMVEIKEWERIKAIDDWNASLDDAD